jgi:hypothetical protein
MYCYTVGYSGYDDSERRVVTHSNRFTAEEFTAIVVKAMKATVSKYIDDYINVGWSVDDIHAIYEVTTFASIFTSPLFMLELEKFGFEELEVVEECIVSGDIRTVYEETEWKLTWEASGVEIKAAMYDQCAIVFTQLRNALCEDYRQRTGKELKRD